MAQLNAAPLTGGTSKFITSVLPQYGSYVPGSESLYLYYKVASSTNNTNVITFGAYIEVSKKYYCNELNYVPLETDYFMFGPDTKLTLTVNDGSYFNICNYTDSRQTNVVGSLLDYEIIGENTDSSHEGYAYIGYARYRYWLGDVNNQPWPEVVASANASTKVFIDWQYTVPSYLTGMPGRITQTIYLSLNNLPYIGYYPTTISDLSNFTINYVIPDPSATDYISFGILDTSGQLLVGYKMAPNYATSYDFQLSDYDLDILYSKYNTVNFANVQFGVRYKNLGGDPILITYPALFEISIMKPSIVYDVLDIDSKASAATGNDETIVRYQSDIQISVMPYAYKKATIVESYIAYGSQKVYNQLTVTFNNATNGSFSVYVKDSRGNSTLTSFTLPIIDYFPVTCNLAAEPPRTDGSISLSLSGKYWEGNFGAKDNHISFQYKYTSNVEGNSIGWTTASPAPSISLYQGNYTCYFDIMVPNHIDTYTVQVRAIDEFGTAVSNSVTVKSTPLFDWGQEDFNFNVPVTIKGDLTVTGMINGSGASSADFIVDQGTSGIWTYRLWDSGVAECWGTVAAAAHSITNAWGSIYTKDNAIARQSYPFTFMDVPVVSMTLYNTSGNCWAYTGTVGSASLSPAFGLARGTSGNVTTGAQITAIGRWK